MIMETYAEKQGEKAMDWNVFLDKAIDGNVPFQGYQHTQALGFASQWTTCACGNQCDIIPRNARGEPCDIVLSGLGCDFYISICNAGWGEAKGILMEIEKRSQEIIDEINN